MLEFEYKLGLKQKIWKLVKILIRSEGTKNRFYLLSTFFLHRKCYYERENGKKSSKVFNDFKENATNCLPDVFISITI